MSRGPDLPEHVEQAVARALEAPPEHVDAALESVVRQFPEHADEVRRVASVWASFSAPADDEPLALELHEGERLGCWSLRRPLGSGGMGTVWLAEHVELHTPAAIKVIKAGMDSAAVVRRFRLEQRTLSRLQHPHVATIFDAGATPGGRPFFVMEFVAGQPLQRWCRDERADLDSRLRLFLQVCSGVQHAHQRGVVHRDLSSNNVLVAVVDGLPMAKVIDFGLARATDAAAERGSVSTVSGGVIGTPEYMAPEQVGLGDVDIDTRVDVWALGVILFELLTDSLPFASAELRRHGFASLHRVLCEVPAPRPSSRPGAFAERLRRDLDWIVLRCLEKDRARRYASVGELAADVERCRSGLPVLARPPAWSYLLASFARRHRGVLIAAGLVLTSLIAGLIASLHFMTAANQRAELIAAQRAEIRERVDHFELLAAVVNLDSARAEFERLPPPTPDTIAALQGWLTDRAEPLLAMRPRVAVALAHIRARALPASAPDHARDRAEHPRRAELLRMEARRREVDRLHELLAAGKELPTVPLPQEVAGLGVADLQKWAWQRVQPDLEDYPEPGVAAARAVAAHGHGLAASGDPLVLARLELTLAWCELRAGAAAAALERIAAAEQRAPLERRYFFSLQRQKLRELHDLAADPTAVRELRAASERLADDVAARRTWRFADPADQFLHDSVAKLAGTLGDLERLESDVRERLDWARKVAALSIDAHRDRWHAAEAAARERGVSTALPPQAGLVPLGTNPVSGLQEFYDLRSAADPAQLPSFDATGALAIDGDSGLVFVLIPGGEARVGASATGEFADPDARADEAPLHAVSLRPFLLSRFEMTQGQWRRLSRGQQPAYFPAGQGYRGSHGLTPWSTPVENVSHAECTRLLAAHGLALPTEVQWEYACRAGDFAPFSGRARAELMLVANVLDRRGTTFLVATGVGEAWDDQHAGPAPVGAFRANAWGLHDMHGNVWEWTADGFHPYDTAARPGDGLRGDPAASPDRVLRGGSWGDRASEARSARRTQAQVGFRSNAVGLRPVRPLVLSGQSGR